jgi:hypothetical protein
MRDRQAIRRLIAALIVAVGCAGAAAAQPYRQQGISPIFDGWEELPDHSRLFYFGYINRANTEVTIPVGAANGFNTTPADRGQPTSFLPGRHRHVFTIKSTDPKDKLTWTVKTEAGVQTANASFDLLYILEERENEDPNAKPPAIAAAPVVARVGETVRLAPQVTAATGGHAAAVEGTAADADGLTIYWSKYRGPGAVTFAEVPGAPKAAAPQSRRAREAMAPGVFVSQCGEKPGTFCGSGMVTFSAPGEYLLRAAARQEEMQGLAFVRVTVNP